MIVNVAILNINEAPEFIGSDAAWKFEIPEKSAVGTSVGAPLSNAAFLSDVDAASTSSFAIVTSVTSGGDGLFSLGATSGQITVASAALDFDTGPKVYECIQTQIAQLGPAANPGVHRIWNHDRGLVPSGGR